MRGRWGRRPRKAGEERVVRNVHERSPSRRGGRGRVSREGCGWSGVVVQGLGVQGLDVERWECKRAIVGVNDVPRGWQEMDS